MAREPLDRIKIFYSLKISHSTLKSDMTFLRMRFAHVNYASHKHMSVYQEVHFDKFA